MTELAMAGNSGRPVTLGMLFFGFLKVGLCAFGGGLVWARRLVVERRQWMTDTEFAEVLSLCQLLPGPNIAGITVCVGSKLRGPQGALAALSGFIAVPWTIGFSLGALYLGYAHFGVLRNILGGISAAAAGLVVATGVRLLVAQRARPEGLLFASLAFAGMMFAKLPLVAVLIGLAPLSIAAAAIAAGKAR